MVEIISLTLYNLAYSGAFCGVDAEHIYAVVDTVDVDGVVLRSDDDAASEVEKFEAADGDTIDADEALSGVGIDADVGVVDVVDG